MVCQVCLLKLRSYSLQINVLRIPRTNSVRLIEAFVLLCHGWLHHLQTIDQKGTPRYSQLHSIPEKARATAN